MWRGEGLYGVWKRGIDLVVVKEEQDERTRRVNTFFGQEEGEGVSC